MGSRRAVLWWFGEINFWIWKMHPERFGMPTKRKQLEHSPVNVVARKGAKNVVGRIWPKLIYNYSKCECFFFSLWTSPYLDLSTRPTINSVRISSKKKCPENYQQVDFPFTLLFKSAWEESITSENIVSGSALAESILSTHKQFLRVLIC